MTQRGRATARPAAGRGDRGRPRPDLGARRARLRAVIEPVLTAAGYDLEELTVSRAGRRHVVRVMVDADGGVSLDDVAEISRAVSAALDEAEETGGELIAGEYQLEVSSPGVDRPLTLPRHWRRNLGRLVRVTVAGAGTPQVAPGATPAGVAGERPAGSSAAAHQVTGRVVTADGERVALDLAGEIRAWAYPDLGPGRVQVEFSRAGTADDEDLELSDDDLSDDEDLFDEDSYEIDDNEDVEGEER